MCPASQNRQGIHAIGKEGFATHENAECAVLREGPPRVFQERPYRLLRRKESHSDEPLIVRLHSVLLYLVMILGAGK